MLVACSACSKRFDAAGYRDLHCPDCGAIAQQRPCPRCELPLVPRRIHDMMLDGCDACRGLFVDQVAKRLLAEQNGDRAEALFRALETEPAAQLPPVDKPTLACPMCGGAMQRKLSNTGAGVVIDVCGTHGTFFDGGELHTMLAFARSTALEEQTRRDEARNVRSFPYDGDEGRIADAVEIAGILLRAFLRLD